VTGGQTASKTNAKGTNKMCVKRTRAPASMCLKLWNEKRLIISAPAQAVTRNATSSPGRPIFVRSLASQTKAATMAAAEGLGRPSK